MRHTAARSPATRESMCMRGWMAVSDPTGWQIKWQLRHRALQYCVIEV